MVAGGGWRDPFASYGVRVFESFDFFCPFIVCVCVCVCLEKQDDFGGGWRGKDTWTHRLLERERVHAE